MSSVVSNRSERNRLVKMENEAVLRCALEDRYEEARKRGFRIGFEETGLRIAEACLKDGLSIEKTAQLSLLPIETVQDIAKRLGIG